MTNFKIDKGVELPKVSTTRGLKYPFDKMKVGESFLSECEIDLDDEEVMQKAKNLRSSISGAARRYAAKFHSDEEPKFTTRFWDDVAEKKVDGKEGVRCWRVG